MLREVRIMEIPKDSKRGFYLTGYSKSKPTLICFAGLCYSEPIIGMGLWQKLTNKTRENPPLFFFNTLTKSKELFTLPSWARAVRMYNCGPTVYGRQHIGNLSMFVFTDILRRTLEYNEFSVKQVINFTDVGHLVSDGDEGEDKMTKGLKNDGLELTVENMKGLGKKYADMFLEDIRTLNIDTEKIKFPFASEHIADDIALIETLEEKSYAYRTKKGVYFDTSRFSEYGKLGSINLGGLKAGARVAADPEKRNPSDFNLWKLNRRLGWSSPWGKGFPGWHVECSAMVHRILGDTIDIHTGGIEHIPVHHNNEMAQTEAATGKPLARFWLHRAHLQLEGGKMAKSEGRVVYLSDIVERGFHPLAFRYLLLGAHYRTSASFSWEALEAAQNALYKLYYETSDFFEESAVHGAEQYLRDFRERINDDLDTPGALAVMWELLKDTSVSIDAKTEALKAFDTVLGLNIAQYLDLTYEVPPEVDKLLRERTAARNDKNWERADELRREIEALGYTVKDTEKGSRVQENPTPQQQN